MTCPYCLEEIKDEALVCKHCRQNLMVFRPLVDRISQLEEQIADIIASINDPQRAAQIPETAAKTDLPFQPIVALVLPVLTSLITYWFIWSLFQAGIQLSPFLFRAIIVFPTLPFGIWLGLALHTTKLKTFPLLGIGVGVVIGIGIQIVYYLRWEQVAPDYFFGFSMFAVGTAFLYTSGAFIGAWLRKRKQPLVGSPGYALLLAKQLVVKKGNTAEETNRVKRLSEAIAALAPILTFLASIIGAYLTFRATIYKK